MAAQTLNYSANYAGASDLLTQADQEVAKLNDSSLLPLRQLLQDDITRVQGAADFDFAGILLKISSLDSLIPDLTLTHVELTVEASKKPASEQGWRAELLKTWEELSKIVVIRHHTQSIQHLLTPERRLYLDQHLELLFNQLQWASLRGEQTLYEETIAAIQEWVKENYAENSDAARSMEKGLTYLAQQQLKPTIPDLKKPLQMLQDAKEKSEQPSKKEQVEDTVVHHIENPSLEDLHPADEATFPTAAGEEEQLGVAGKDATQEDEQ